MTQSPQFEKGAGGSEGYDEAGCIWGCEMVLLCGTGDPLNSSAAKDQVVQAGVKASFAVCATGYPGSEWRVHICSQERRRRHGRSMFQACAQKALLMWRCRVRTGSRCFTGSH